jgi:uncharacterized protein (DUF885 family)
MPVMPIANEPIKARKTNVGSNNYAHRTERTGRSGSRPLAAALLALFGAVTVTADDAALRRKELNDLIAEEWKYEVVYQPEMATVIGEPGHNDKLSDLSPAANRADAGQRRRFLQRLEAIDTTGFPEQERLNKELLVRKLREDLRSYELKQYEMPIDQIFGYHLQVAQLVSVSPFQNVKDYEDYLSRLHQLPQTFDQLIESARAGEKDGLMPPRFLLEKVIGQAAGLSVADQQNPFALPVAKFPAGIAEADQRRLRTAVLAAVEDDVSSAYHKLEGFVKTEYAPKGRLDDGMWAVPNGEELYRFAVRQNTTTELTPSQIHELGLRQVAEITAQMSNLAKRLGYSDLKSLEEAVRDNKEQYASSPEEILGLYRKYTDEMSGRLPQLFNNLPKAGLTVVPVEPFREKAAPVAQYYPPAQDGSRKGQIVVNTGDFEHRALYPIESFAYHEGIPGHHFQISSAQELGELPAFRRNAFYTAYVEGWGLYAERLGKDVGLYQDPYSEYGRLTDEMFRAIRLVVDTGVHEKHWTRQQMVDYFHQHSTIDEPSIQAEVDRYIAFPGQALAYKIGQLKILELREQARAELGARFDIKAFHDELLGGGALPLDILEQRMTAWIAVQKQNRSTVEVQPPHIAVQSR